MARVYVSSTFMDLKDHREAVRQAIRRLGHEDVAMEYYVAEDVRPVEKCLADVRSADLYIVIMAWRYGFIPPGDEKSITEQEYRAALEADVPCLAFVLSEDQPWLPKFIEHSAKVAEFRTELMQERVTGLFTSKDDLARQVAEGIQQWERSGDAVSAGVDWDAYRRAVVERYCHVRLSVIAGAQYDRLARIPLLDVFVPQQLRSGRPNYDLPENGAGPAPAEDSVVVLGREPKQVILGGPGSGKSTLLQASLLAISDVAGDASRVPLPLQDLPLVLLIELRQYALMGSPDFLTYLTDSVWANFNVLISEAQLVEVLNSGGAVVFFDGLDEIFEQALRDRVIDQFRAFTARFASARVVVSSRIVGYDDNELGLAGFEHYTLLDFGLKEIREFVPAWYEHYTVDSDDRDAAGLIHRVVDNPRLLELAGNPLLLTMMAVIYKHQDLPEKRWKLYERCTDVLLEDWDVKRKRIRTKELLPLGLPLGRDQKAEMLQEVAMTMVTSSRRRGSELNAIGYEPLRDIIATYLQRQYSRPPGEARAIAVEILNHLRGRTFILAETGDGVFGFVHRTFMEYFAARHVLAEFNRRKADYGWLKAEVFWKHWQHAEWREPLLLLSAMLAAQKSPIREIVAAVADVQLTTARPFAVRCLGEAGSVPQSDQKWAAGLVAEMVDQLSFISPKDPYRADYAADVASALASLAGLVTLSDETLQTISNYRRATIISNRMIGFQLELAIASRAERRKAAISGLSDPDEAVRRAAVAVLDRESGDEAVFIAFVDRLRDERNTRVREPLITALDRGWPRRHAVLEAIAPRVFQETSYKHALWVAEHLAVAWAGDGHARQLVLNLAMHSYAENLPGVVGDVAFALMKGWRDTPDFHRFLLDQLDSGASGGVRKVVIEACAVTNLELLCGWMWQSPVGSSDLMAVIRATRARRGVVEWVETVADSHPDAQFRDTARRVHEWWLNHSEFL